MAKKDKKDKEWQVKKLTGKDLEAFERSGLNTAVLEGGNVYYLAKLKKEDGEEYYKPYAPDGKLFVTAVTKQKAESKFEKLIANYAGAAVAAGTFASIEAVDKVAKPGIDNFLEKDKTTVDFSKVDGFTCVLPKESDLQKDVKEDVKGILKTAKKVEKFAKKEVKELYELDDVNFEVFAVNANDQSLNLNMWDALDAKKEAAKEEEQIREEDEEEKLDEEAEESEEYDESEDEEEYDDEEDEYDEDEEEEMEDDSDEEEEEEEEEEDLEF